MSVFRKYFTGPRAWVSSLVLAGIAAIIATVLVLLLSEGRGYFRGAVEAYEQELAADEDYNWVGIMRGMTREAVPMLEQLPEEMSDKEKARLLKSYYGDILAGVEKLKNAR